ncbi:hypothetical protein RUND412_004747 [Rhizina undulata]
MAVHTDDPESSSAFDIQQANRGPVFFVGTLHFEGTKPARLVRCACTCAMKWSGNLSPCGYPEEAARVD